MEATHWGVRRPGAYIADGSCDLFAVVGHEQDEGVLDVFFHGFVDIDPEIYEFRFLGVRKGKRVR